MSCSDEIKERYMEACIWKSLKKNMTEPRVVGNSHRILAFEKLRQEIAKSSRIS